MLLEGEPAAEGLAALAALVGLLPRVELLVLPELGAAPEGLAALAALVGLLLGVDPAARGQLGALLEGLAALAAPVGLLLGVDRSLGGGGNVRSLFSISLNPAPPLLFSSFLFTWVCCVVFFPTS